MVFITDDKKGILATISDTGQVYVPPGASRDEVAFVLFKVMLELMNRPMNVAMTWGSAYLPIGANQGNP